MPRHGRPHYLNFLYQLMAIRSSSGFSHLRPGAFNMFYKSLYSGKKKTHSESEFIIH